MFLPCAERVSGDCLSATIAKDATSLAARLSALDITPSEVCRPLACRICMQPNARFGCRLQA